METCRLISNSCVGPAVKASAEQWELWKLSASWFTHYNSICCPLCLWFFKTAWDVLRDKWLLRIRFVFVYKVDVTFTDTRRRIIPEEALLPLENTGWYLLLALSMLQACSNQCRVEMLPEPPRALFQSFVLHFLVTTRDVPMPFFTPHVLAEAFSSISGRIGGIAETCIVIRTIQVMIDANSQPVHATNLTSCVSNEPHPLLTNEKNTSKIKGPVCQI